MVDPSATDRLQGLLVDVSQIDAAQLGSDRPSGLKSQRHCLALISYVQINRKGHVEINRPKVKSATSKMSFKVAASDSLSRCVAAGYISAAVVSA